MEPGPNQLQDPGQEALSQALQVSFRALRVVLLLILAFYLVSGIVIVGQHERAFVLTFGKLQPGPHRLKGPGLHFALPRPFSEVVRIPFARTRSVETEAFWNRPPTPAESAAGPAWHTRNRPFAYFMTGDANLAHSRWALRYTLLDAERATFGLADLDAVLRHELEHAVVKVAGHLGVEQVLRSDLEGFRGAVEIEVRDRIAHLDLAVTLQRVDLLDQSPALQVVDAFDAVIQAEQERSRKISQARAYSARTESEARGDAARLEAEARADRERAVAEVRADADYFERMLAKYNEQSDVLKQALLHDTLRRTLAQVEEKYIVKRSGDGKQQIRLHLGPEQANPYESRNP